MDLSGKTVAILATDLFEESELTKPKEALDRAGAKTVVIAPHDGEIQAMQHADKTIKVPVDEILSRAAPEDFDAVMLPGGAMNADHLRIDHHAQEFVRAIDEAGKPVAAICHAPWLLISAKLVNGHKMTSYHTIADDLINAGADWVDQEVVVDGTWVTSRQPGDIPVFNEALIKLIAEA